MTYKEKKGWISMPEMIVSSDRTQLGLILPTEQEGNLGNFRHLVTVNISEPTNMKALTSGKYTVTELLAWDETYMLVLENNVLISHILRVTFKFWINFLFFIWRSRPFLANLKNLTLDLPQTHQLA